MNYEKDLPRICPGCGKVFGEDAFYMVSGIQYCFGGSSIENIHEDHIDLPDLDDDIRIDVEPYYIKCDECGYVLLDRELTINKKKE